MLLYEVDDILECIPYMDRNNWEQCRLNTYITSMIDHKKVKIDELITFPWEEKKDNSKIGNIEISNEEIKYMKELSKKWSNNNG